MAFERSVYILLFISGGDGSSDVGTGTSGMYSVWNKCFYYSHNLHEGKLRSACKSSLDIFPSIIYSSFL